MKVKVENILTPEEVLMRIKNFEKKYESKFPEFYEKNRKSTRFLIKEDIEEWQKLCHAYSAYLEEGELFLRIFDEIKIPDQVISSLFTKERIKILKTLNTQKIESISHLSRVCNRDIKNVYQDLILLEKFNLIHLEKSRKNRIPRLKAERILFEITV